MSHSGTDASYVSPDHSPAYTWVRVVVFTVIIPLIPLLCRQALPSPCRSITGSPNYIR